MPQNGPKPKLPSKKATSKSNGKPNGKGAAKTGRGGAGGSSVQQNSNSQGNRRKSMVMVPNRGDLMPVRRGGDLSRLGNTTSGSQWAMRVLHPCAEGLTFVPKVPDGALDSSVAFERRDEWQLKPPAFADKPTTWNIIVVEAPFLFAPIIAVAFSVSVTSTQQAVKDALIDGLTKPDVYNKDWVAYGSYYVKVLTPTVLDHWNPTSPQSLDNFASIMRSIRRTYCGTTLDLDAPTLANQGRLVVAQVPPGVTKQDGVPTYRPEQTGDPTPDSVEMEWSFLLPPVSFNTEVQTDLKVVEKQAKIGAYNPSRMWGCPDLTEYYERYGLRIHYDFTSQGYSSDQYKSGNYHLRGWGWTVSNFEGISIAASIRLKRREGLELAPGNFSLFAPFATDGYLEDAKAISVVKAYFRRQAHSYPSSFNELNKMIPTLVAGLGSVLSSLGMPIAGPLSQIVSGILRQL
nr:putative capsid protein [Helianthus astrovirus A]QVG60633.1 putative capsid protein [Helianthus astrovirus A]